MNPITILNLTQSIKISWKLDADGTKKISINLLLLEAKNQYKLVVYQLAIFHVRTKAVKFNKQRHVLCI